VVFAIAELERARFYNEEALAAFTLAADTFRAHKEWALEAKALLGIGDIERRLNQIYAADNAVSRARAIFEIIGDRSGLRAAEDAWEELLTYVSETDDLRLGLAYDIGFTDAGGSRLREAQGYLGMGLLDSAAGFPGEARLMFESARLVFAEMRVPNGVFDAWAGLGEMERRLGYFEAAQAAFTQAMEAYEQARSRTSREAEEHEDTSQGALSVRASLVLIARGELDTIAGLDANPWFNQARTLSSRGSSAQVDGAMLIGRAGQYRAEGDLENAAEALSSAADIFSNAGLNVGLGKAYLAHADLDLAQGETIAALGYFAQSLEAFLVARDRIGEGDARWAWAGTLAAIGGNEMAANIQYRIAARIFNELELPDRAAAALAAADALN
jgi:tetratricopeptide (TPR) repeat protein